MIADIGYRVLGILGLVFMGKLSVIPIACCLWWWPSSVHMTDGTTLENLFLK